jgi:hypothetical protein
MSETQSSKPTRRRKAKGLGDTIDAITTATGVKAVVKAIAGSDCGCDERRTALNLLFPYYRTFAPVDKRIYEQHLAAITLNDTITAATQHLAIDLYQRYTGRRQEYTRCPSCMIRVLNELKTIYEHTCDDSDPTPEPNQA